MLEYIPNHAYDRSRFLAGGAAVDETKIPAVKAPEAGDKASLVYLHPARERFHLLDKILSFDYVAATRAARNLYVIEGEHRHPALRLLELDRFAGELEVEQEASSRED